MVQEQNNAGLYRNDGLGIFRRLSGPNIEWKALLKYFKIKEIIKIF